MTLTEKAERIYSRLEHRADAIIHALGILFAINASAWLLFHVTGLPVTVSVSIYCLGLLAMIGFSAVYNLWPQQRPAKQVLRRFDHAAIFIMIAGTYTPLAVNRVAGSWGDTLLIIMWACAAFGVMMKLLFPHRFEFASVTLYLAMGWMGVTVIKPLSVSVASADLWLLIAGGLVYSAGVAFYLIERIPYHKAIWHALVLAAAVLQFAAIAGEFVS